LGVIVGICLGFLVARPAVASAPTTINIPEDFTSGNIVIKDNAIQQPTDYAPIPPIKRPVGNRPVQPSGWHSIRTDKRISRAVLRVWLQERGSPLAGYSDQLMQSPYWSTILGICQIEQYGCARLPGGKNYNLWGIGGSSGLAYYSTPEQAIEAISMLLARYEESGHDTIEKLNGYYVQPASANWLNTVLRTKSELESLQ